MIKEKIKEIMKNFSKLPKYFIDIYVDNIIDK